MNSRLNEVSATEAKVHFGKYLEEATHEPVMIKKSGRNYAVMMSAKEYERLVEAEEYLWGLRALQLDKKDFLSAEESKKFMDRILNE